MKKCAGYIRVSKGEFYQGTSLENQKEFLIQQAKVNNLELVEFYIDTKTGTTKKRPELNRMIEDFQSKKFEVVICKESSRLARNVPLAYKIKDSVESSDIDIITFDGAINTLIGNTQFFGIYACINEIEAESASRRLKALLDTRANNGLFNGSIPPYGYSCTKGKLYIRNDDTPKIVQYIFDEYIKGKGVDSIARSLTLDGIPTPSMSSNKKNAGYEWHGSSITDILNNEAYIGNMVQQKERTLNAISEKRIKSDDSQVVRVKNTHEAIISNEDFIIVQGLMKSRSRHRSTQTSHLFSPISFCADCGKKMTYKKNSRGYVCSTFNRPKALSCSSHRIREAVLIEKILTDINMLISSVPSAKISSVDFKKKLDKILLKLKVKIQSLEKKIEQQETIEFETYKRYALGEFEKDKYELYIKKLSKETESNKNELAHCKESLAKLQNASISEVISSLENSPLTITSLTPEILNKFIERIEISEAGDAKIFYRFSAPNISA